MVGTCCNLMEIMEILNKPRNSEMIGGGSSPAICCLSPGEEGVCGGEGEFDEFVERTIHIYYELINNKSNMWFWMFVSFLLDGK